MSKVKIELNEYSYTCSDGCCTTYGTITKVNGVELNGINQDAATILTKVLEHLGFEVELTESYDHD